MVDVIRDLVRVIELTLEWDGVKGADERRVTCPHRVRDRILCVEKLALSSLGSYIVDIDGSKGEWHVDFLPEGTSVAFRVVLLQFPHCVCEEKEVIGNLRFGNEGPNVVEWVEVRSGWDALAYVCVV